MILTRELVGDFARELTRWSDLRQSLRKNGRQYHIRVDYLLRQLSSEFDDVRASICFAELLGHATQEKSGAMPAQFYKLLKCERNFSHLEFLEKELFGSSRPKLIFVTGICTWRVVEKIKVELPYFRQLKCPQGSTIKANDHVVELQNGFSPKIRVFVMTHFSAAVSNEHLKRVAELIVKFLREN